MAVQRRLNVISQQRVDVPDLRSIESAASNDFDQLFQAFVTGTSQGYIVRGFNILMAGAIGGASNALQVQVDPGAVMHILASQSGTILMAPVGTAAQLLNASINPNVVGAFSPSSVNYVSLDYTRSVDNSTAAQVYLWDPTSNDETTISAPRAIILNFSLNISTLTPTSNLLPIATVLTDASNNVLSITDDRWLLGRLGTGGITPNPFYVYPWPDGRQENPVTASSTSSPDPFTGGDKNFVGLKDWMNAVMSMFLELKGTTYWYSPNSSGSLASLRQDLGNTVITGSGSIAHGIIPNSVPVLSTTGDTGATTDQITNLASTLGLVTGLFVFGTGVPTGTHVTAVSGSTATLSQEATLTLTGTSFSFYSPASITQPGQINWDEPINIRVIGSALNYVLATNESSDFITLADDQAAYITLTRDAAITPNLIFTQGSPTVASVGNVSWTGSLEAGDLIRLASDTSAGYYTIDTVDSLTSVTLTTNFTETSTGAGGAQSVYAFGNYVASATPSGDPRAIQISSREAVPQGQDVFWLFLRNDNGGAPRVYIRFLGSELDNGEDRQVSGPTSDQLLQYIGSPSAAASFPEYVSAINPNSVPQVELLSFGTGAQTTNDTYFQINSSGNTRKYYVWFNVSGSGVDPNPGGGTNASIEVDIASSATAAQVAAAVTIALNNSTYKDFVAVQGTGGNAYQVTVTNASAGLVVAASAGTMAAPFTVAATQTGTGAGNAFIHDGDNLTLAIKELDMALASFLAAVDEPTYDETVDVLVSGTPPASVTGPVTALTPILLPTNSRQGGAVQKYTVGAGYLEVYLNGVYQRLNADWQEVGVAGALSSSIEFTIGLVIGDSIEFRMTGIGGGGSGGGGGEGPPGPTGPSGPPGSDAVGGPVAITTKSGSPFTYSVLLADNVILVDCTGTATFTVFLPSASSATGRVFYCKKIDGTAGSMVISSSQLIDGANTLSTSVQYESFTLICDGTQYYIF